MLNLGYTFNMKRNLKIIPSLGAGYYIFFMKFYDPNDLDIYGNAKQKRKTYFDPAISLKTEIDYAVTSTIHAYIAPSYTFAFEKKQNPQMAGAEAGIKMFF